MPAFYLGVAEELEKYADTSMSAMPVNENILPTITNQAKWKYVRTKDGLKLTDGNLVYSFGGLPEQYPAEDAPVTRTDQDNSLNFEHDAVSKGTAQIHRAGPDNIYMTLTDGSMNPTFMLQHEKDKQWRYTPAKKFLQKLKTLQESALPQQREEASTVALDPAALMAGASDTIKSADESYFHDGSMDATSLARLVKDLRYGAGDYLQNKAHSIAAHPTTSLLQSYAISKSLHALKDMRDPESAELRKMDPAARARHELLPIGEAALPVLASMAYEAK